MVMGILPGSLAEVLLCGQPHWFWVESQEGRPELGLVRVSVPS